MNKFKSLVLTVIGLLCSISVSAHDFGVDGIYYNITSSTDMTVGVTYRGLDYESYSDEYIGSVVIPESVTYGGSTYRVTKIGNYAFRNCSGLTSVVIPNSVTSIGSYAFRNCSGLTSVVIPNSVTSIGESAFYGCSGLTSVNIEDVATWCKINFVGSHANPLSCADSLYLNGKKVTELVIPNSVTSIGSYAISGCSSLKSVVIPNSVTSIGSSAFSGCSGLTSVVIPNSVTSIGDYAFEKCSGLTSVVIPNSVTSIGRAAFGNCI